MDTLMTLAMLAKAKVSNFFKDEEGDVNIVTIVVLIGVAVLLALLFKGAIGNLLNSMFGTINNNAQNAIGGK